MSNRKPTDRKTHTAEGRKRIDTIKKEWAEYLKQFDPKPIKRYKENGHTITVYESR